MNTKKVIIRMGMIAFAVVVVSGGLRITQLMVDHSHQEQSTKKRNQRIQALSKQYQEFLDRIAGQIKSNTVALPLIGEIKSEVLKLQPATHLYLWMSNPEGLFIFGEPEPVFLRLNQVYDNYRDVIDNQGLYMDRNDFLLQLVDQHEHIRPSELRMPADARLNTWWLNPRRSRGEYYGTISLVLSSPAQSENGEAVGNLFLKILDLDRQSWQAQESTFLRTILFEPAVPFFGLGLAFLWFLLPAWVYVDARQRDIRKPFTWALLTLFSFVFGLAIYLITRPNETSSFFCPECRKELNGSKSFCPHCGKDLSTFYCSGCQYPLKPEWQFCPSCRQDLRGGVTAEGAAEKKEKER